MIEPLFSYHTVECEENRKVMSTFDDFSILSIIKSFLYEKYFTNYVIKS